MSVGEVLGYELVAPKHLSSVPTEGMLCEPTADGGSAGSLDQQVMVAKQSDSKPSV